MKKSRYFAAVASFSIAACGSNAQAESFAIACKGTAQFMDTIQGKPVKRSYDLPRQIYVFDESAKRVQRAMIPRQQFEDVCFRGGYIDNIIFSPGLISVRSERAGAMCDFKVDRASGKAEFVHHSDLPAGGLSSIEFQMTCDPADLPVFDKSRNKF
ncbi:hypothetical protein [Sphingomonas sp.]|uniref:hypothetical protein n=1 Tax=Sphingomonas sp. TaxID=28214 RepID=UPI001822A38E|nr:hypothetical protein [Sphingomonas sp.]MBA3512676.1 hypothetical protein [Sphingomonas sp.]